MGSKNTNQPEGSRVDRDFEEELEPMAAEETQTITTKDEAQKGDTEIIPQQNPQEDTAELTKHGEETAETERESKKPTEQALEEILNIAEVANALRLKDIEQRYGAGLLGRFRAFLAGEFDFDILPEGETRKNALKTLARKAVVSIFNRRTLLGGAVLAGVGIFTGGIGSIALYSMAGGVLGNTLAETLESVLPKTPTKAREALLKLYITSSQAMLQRVKQKEIKNPEDVSQLFGQILNQIQYENQKQIQKHHQRIIDLEKKWNIVKSAFYGLGALAGGALGSLSEMVSHTQNLSNIQHLGWRDFDGDGFYHYVVKVGDQLYYQIRPQDIEFARTTGWPLTSFKIESLQGMWHSVLPNQPLPSVQSSLDVFSQLSWQAPKLRDLAPAAGALCVVWDTLRQPKAKPIEVQKPYMPLLEEGAESAEAIFDLDPVNATKPEFLHHWEKGETYAFYALTSEGPKVFFATINDIFTTGDNQKVIYEATFYKPDENGNLQEKAQMWMDGDKMANAARIKINLGDRIDLEEIRERLENMTKPLPDREEPEQEITEATEPKEEKSKPEPQTTEPATSEKTTEEEEKEEEEETKIPESPLAATPETTSPLTQTEKEKEEEEKDEEERVERKPTPPITKPEKTPVKEKRIEIGNLGGIKVNLRGQIEEILPQTKMLVKEEKIIYSGQEIAPGERIRFTSKEGKSITLVYEGKDYNDNAIFQVIEQS